MERYDEVRQWWDRHLKTRMPSRWKSEDIAGVEMILVDNYIAGCVHTWLKNDGSLDSWRLGVVEDHIAQLDTVLPLLTDPLELAYAHQLREGAELVRERPGLTPASFR